MNVLWFLYSCNGSAVSPFVDVITPAGGSGGGGDCCIVTVLVLVVVVVVPETIKPSLQSKTRLVTEGNI